MKKLPWIFFLLVLLLSLPFWLAGALLRRLDIPINLPISALQAVNPLIAAVILLSRQKEPGGVKALLRRTFDFRRVKSWIWYLPTLGIWPLAMVLSYGVKRITAAPLPDPRVPLLMAPVFFVGFFIYGAAEELGWQGYLMDRLQGRWSALGAALLTGAVWGAWHVYPFTQGQRAPDWILWQALGMIPFRILIVWLYNNTGRSVFAASAFHAMSNVSQFLFPNYGSHYDPFQAFVILALFAAVVILLWGPKTLSRRTSIPPRQA